MSGQTGLEARVGLMEDLGEGDLRRVPYSFLGRDGAPYLADETETARWPSADSCARSLSLLILLSRFTARWTVLYCSSFLTLSALFVSVTALMTSPLYSVFS